MASYGSLFLGVPLGVVPLIQRDDAYALTHAKHSVAVWVASMIAVVGLFALSFFLFFFTCGMSNFVMIPIIMILALWPMGHALHGLIIAINGGWEAPIGSFGLGERFFYGVKLKESPALLE